MSAQEASLDELRARSGNLLSAGGVVSAFLGGAALTGGKTADGFEALALVTLAISSVLLVMQFWPRGGWQFRLGTKDLLRDYIETDAAPSMAVIHRSLAWQSHRYGRECDSAWHHRSAK
jgi:hypothetical protein